MSMEKRFFAKTKLASTPRLGMDTPCLEWQGASSRGYGQFWVSGKYERSHRVAWAMKNGTIPDGLNVLHRCDNPPCVRVDHLFLGTQEENNADRDAKGRQVARHGEKHGNAKLTEADVRRIFRLRSIGWKQRRIASAVGVSQLQISHILTGKQWAHLGLASIPQTLT